VRRLRMKKKYNYTDATNEYLDWINKHGVKSEPIILQAWVEGFKRGFEFCEVKKDEEDD